MNPSSNVGMELPPPVGEQALSPPELPQKAQNTSLEQVPTPSYETLAGPISTGTVVSVPPPPPSIPLPIQQAQSTASSAVSDNNGQITATAIAEDKDLIEKEWVDKARAIVESTKEDPYKQSEELILLKADYLQKRYNKTLKLSN